MVLAAIHAVFGVFFALAFDCRGAAAGFVARKASDAFDRCRCRDEHPCADAVLVEAVLALLALWVAAKQLHEGLTLLALATKVAGCEGLRGVQDDRS